MVHRFMRWAFEAPITRISQAELHVRLPPEGFGCCATSAQGDRHYISEATFRWVCLRMADSANSVGSSPRPLATEKFASAELHKGLPERGNVLYRTLLHSEAQVNRKNAATN
jgi:hypothetical protein